MDLRRFPCQYLSSISSNFLSEFTPLLSLLKQGGHLKNKFLGSTISIKRVRRYKRTISASFFVNTSLRTSLSTALAVLESLVGMPAWPSAWGSYCSGIAEGGGRRSVAMLCSSARTSVLALLGSSRTSVLTSLISDGSTLLLLVESSSKLSFRSSEFLTGSMKTSTEL